MPAARVSSSSESGNGDHSWLTWLIGEIQQITRELQELAGRIGLVADPAEADVKKAHDLVSKLLALIVRQVLPHRGRLSKLASAPSLTRDLNRALESLNQSGQKALIAMDVYKKTLSNENRQRRSERRSNTRYAADQESLQKRRYEAAVKVNELITGSERFMRYISS
jgi:hypothetical protein